MWFKKKRNAKEMSCIKLNLDLGSAKDEQIVIGLYKDYDKTDEKQDFDAFITLSYDRARRLKDALERMIEENDVEETECDYKEV